MINFIVKLDQKGWFKGLGLHHASIAIIPLAIGLILLYFNMPVLGAFFSSWGGWFFMGRELKESEIRSSGGFEIMDFISPFIISLIFLVIYTCTKIF